MTLSIALFILLAISLLYALFAHQKASKSSQIANTASQELNQLQSKMAQLKGDLSTTKEDLNRKQKMLDETRESTRKKLKKLSQKTENENDTSPIDMDTDRLQKAYVALEIQLKETQKAAQIVETETEKKVREETAEQIKTLSEENKRLSKDNNSLKHSQKSKRETALAALEIPFENVPETVQEEIARLLRRSENYERLYGIAQGKFQLSQERFGELQKRYFAVCRELAVALGQPEVSETQAREVAETVLEASEKQTA